MGMGCCNGCDPCHKRLTCWQVVVVLNGFLFLGAAIMAMSALTGDVKTTLQCIVDSCRTLLAPVSNPQLSAGAQAASQISTDTLDNIDNALDQIDIAAVAPGVVCFVFIFITV